MPDLDTRLTRALNTVADDGRARSRPVAGSFIRGTATSRSRRRLVVVSTTAAIALVAAGTTVLTGEPFSGGDVRTSGPATTGDAGRGSALVTQQEVSDSLGSRWDWKAAPVDQAPGRITPCQAAASADPARISAEARVVTGGWSGDDTLSELVEVSATPDAAHAAFERAVAWFTECGGKGVDQSAEKGSLTTHYAAAGQVVADEARVVVRMREHLGPDTWTNTVAAVIRVGERVAIIAWDNTIDDNPGAYDNGFVQLVHVASARLNGQSVVTVPETAMLGGTEAPITALVDSPHVSSSVDSGRPPATNLLCPDETGSSVPDAIVGRHIDIAPPNNTPLKATVAEWVRVYGDVTAAHEAFRGSDPHPSQCDMQLGAGASPIDYQGGDESRATRFGGLAREGSGYLGVVRVGRAVAYTRVDVFTTEPTDAEVVAVFEAAAQRLTAAYG